jgi:hypothetical protein
MNNTPTTKTCTRCSLTKAPLDFHKNVDRLRSQCKPCNNALARDKYHKERSPSPMQELSRIAQIANSEPPKVWALRNELEDITRQIEGLNKWHSRILETIGRLTREDSPSL